MALSISAAAIIEKNKLASDGVWLILLEVKYGTADPLRFVRNNENINWNGAEWIAFPFELDDQTEDSKGEIPSLKIRVSNVTRAVQFYLEQINGGVGSKVTIRVVNSEHLDILTPELEEAFEVVNVDTDEQWVTFELGPGYPVVSRRPQRKMSKNHCPHEYGSAECGVLPDVKAAMPTCDHTLPGCRQRQNAVRFGGEPAIPGGGIYV